MAKDYNNPLDQMKAISWNLKRIADLLESIEDKMNSPKPVSMSETYQFKPKRSASTVYQMYEADDFL